MKGGKIGLCPQNFEKHKEFHASSDAGQMRRTVLKTVGWWQSDTKGRQLKLQLFWLDGKHHWAASYFRTQQFFRYPQTYPHFMQSESSLPCSQQPATCPYPDLNLSSSRLPFLVFFRSTLILHSRLRLDHSGNLFPSCFSAKTFLIFYIHYNITFVSTSRSSR